MPKTEEPLTQLATRIPKELHRRLKLYCVTNDTSVMEFVVEALKERLAQARSQARQNHHPDYLLKEHPHDAEKHTERERRKGAARDAVAAAQRRRRSTSLYFAAARERAVAALCKALTDGGDNNFVIIEVDTSRDYYAQFMTKRDKPDVHGELVSNEWLDEPHKLTEDAQDRLRSLGWHQDRDVGGLGGGNFYKRWVIGVDGVTETTIIEEALSALRDVYGVGFVKPIKLRLNLE